MERPSPRCPRILSPAITPHVVSGSHPASLTQMWAEAPRVGACIVLPSSGPRERRVRYLRLLDQAHLHRSLESVSCCHIGRKHMCGAIERWQSIRVGCTPLFNPI